MVANYPYRDKHRLLWCVFALIIPIGITACSHTPVAVCPTPVEYTTGQQLEAIEQIQNLPPESILVRFLLDYSELRERLRACQ